MRVVECVCCSPLHLSQQAPVCLTTRAQSSDTRGHFSCLQSAFPSWWRGGGGGGREIEIKRERGEERERGGRERGRERRRDGGRERDAFWLPSVYSHYKVSYTFFVDTLPFYRLKWSLVTCTLCRRSLSLFSIYIQPHFIYSLNMITLPLALYTPFI